MAEGRGRQSVASGIIVLVAVALAGCAPSSSVGRTPVESILEMRHHDVVIQKWDLSCGAAALATILHYQWDDPATEREIALSLMSRQVYIAHPELIRSREGFSLLDLKRYADAHGYRGTGYGDLTFHDLLTYAPIMVPVDMLGYHHFVVFRGVYDGRVLLADPAWGNRTMTVAQFESMWLNFGKPIGRVGFVVESATGRRPLDTLAPAPPDFPALG